MFEEHFKRLDTEIKNAVEKLLKMLSDPAPIPQPKVNVIELVGGSERYPEKEVKVDKFGGSERMNDFYKENNQFPRGDFRNSTIFGQLRMRANSCVTLVDLTSEIVSLIYQLQELVVVANSSFDPSILNIISTHSSKLSICCDQMSSTAHQADFERSLQGLDPPREANMKLANLVKILLKEAESIVALNNLTFSQISQLNPSIIVIGENLDGLVGSLVKSVSKYVSVVKAEMKLQYSDLACEVLTSVGKIHFYVTHMLLPKGVSDIDLYQETRDSKLNEMVSKTKAFTAASKTSFSYWPPPDANEKAIDSAREVISIVKDLVLHIKNSGGGDQILEISTFDDSFQDLIFICRSQAKKMFSSNLDTSTKLLVTGISKLLDIAKSGEKEKLLDSLSAIQQSLTEIFNEIEKIPGFTDVKRQLNEIDHNQETDVDEASSHDWEGVSLITSEIVKGLKKLIDEIHSGFATSEDYLECMFTITTKSQKLILLLGPSETGDFSERLKKLMNATQIAAGVWAPPTAVVEMKSCAFDLALALKSIRNKENLSKDLGSRPKNLLRSQSQSGLNRVFDGQGARVSRSLSTMDLNSKSQYSDEDDLIDEYSKMGDDQEAMVTTHLKSALSSLVLATKLIITQYPPENAFENLKLAAQDVAKETKILISSAISYHIQLEINGKKEVINNELSDLLAKKGIEVTTLPRFSSDEFPKSPLVFEIQKHEEMSPIEFQKLMQEDNSDIVLELGNNSEIPTVKAATIPKLVERLTYYKYPDPDLTESFLMTYRSFITPVGLLRAIIKIYEQSPPSNLSHQQFDIYFRTKVIPTRLRVMNVLKIWIDKHFEDFEADPDLNGILVSFVSNRQIHETSTFIQAANQLKKLHEKKSRRRRQSIKLLLFNQKMPAPILPKSLKKFTLVDIDPLELARQITDIEHNLYKAIQPKECLNQAWNKPKLAHRSPNIINFIHRFNSLTKKIAVEILKCDSKKGRASRIKHFIAVAEKLRYLNNFNAVTSVIAALTSSPIRRLAKTWEHLSKKSTERIEALDALMTHHSNYAAYRQVLHTSDPPCVPFLGVYLTDLVFIEDGNKDQINGLINFDKSRKISLVIREIQQYQQTPYCITKVPEIQALLLSNDQQTEEDLYKMSLELEPRSQK